MKLYFPTTSLNFNEIFSTETVSPPSFYCKRIFGTKRYFKTELQKSLDYTFLFNKPPYFDLIENSTSEYDEYPIILCIDVNNLQQYNVYEITDGIFVTNTTIYLSKDKLDVFFFSDEHKNIILSKSNTVSEVKTIQKYFECFKIIDRSTLTKFNIVEPLCYPELRENSNQLNLFKDRLFNSIKGFFYGYILMKQATHINDNYTKYQLEIKRLDELHKVFKINSLLKEDNSEMINDILKVAEKYCSKNRRSIEKEYNRIRTSIYIVHFSEKYDIKVSKDEFSDEQDLLIYEIIINILLKNPRQMRNENDKESLCNIVSLIKMSIKDIFNYTNIYYKDICLIEERVKNSNIDIYIELINSVLMQNLFCFLIKYSNIDEFTRYIELKNISNCHIAYSFLGAYFGFADLSKVLTNSIINSKCLDLNKCIDKYLMELKYKIEHIQVIPDIYKINYNKSTTGSLDRISTDNHISDEKDGLIERDSKSVPVKSNLCFASDYLILKKQLYIEIYRIKQFKIINKLLKAQSTILENKAILNIHREKTNVELSFKLNNYDNEVVVLLIYKENVGHEYLLTFKGEILKLGINKNICTGKYPAFRCYKKIEDKIYKLNNSDELELLNTLRLIK